MLCKIDASDRARLPNAGNLKKKLIVLPTESIKTMIAINVIGIPASFRGSVLSAADLPRQ